MSDLNKILKLNGKSKIPDLDAGLNQDYYMGMKSMLEYIRDNFDCEPSGGVLEDIKKKLDILCGI